MPSPHRIIHPVHELPVRSLINTFTTHPPVLDLPSATPNMKLPLVSALALSAAVVNARFVERHERDQVVLNAEAADNDRYLVELAPGQTQWVTEEEKWELRRVCSSYFREEIFY